MKIHELVNQLGMQLDVPGLQLDVQMNCALRFGGDVHVDLHYQEIAEVLCLATDVASLQEWAHVVPTLLKANLDTRALGGAYFARRGSAVALCRSVDIEALSLERLTTVVTDLVTRCREWREHLDERHTALA